MTASSFSEAFPNSRKVTVDGARGIRVPMREIALTIPAAPRVSMSARGCRRPASPGSWSATSSGRLPVSLTP